jgi:hypothetical protein
MCMLPPPEPLTQSLCSYPPPTPLFRALTFDTSLLTSDISGSKTTTDIKTG